jgi:hypothetical protein
MRKYNTLSGMPQIQFNKGEKKFEAMNPGEDADVPTITKRLNQFRRPDDQLPTYDKDQGTFVKGNKKGPLTDFKEETLFQDIIPRLQGKKINYNKKKPVSDLDLLYSASTPSEKREMRQKYKEYNFVKKAFKEDLRKQEVLKQKSEPIINFSPIPNYYETRKELIQEKPKQQPKQPKPEGITQVLFSAPPKETGGLDEIIEDAVFRLKNPWINGGSTLERRKKSGDDKQGGTDDR